MKLTVEQFAAGRVIREPVGFENGYWAGAPGAFYEPNEKAWYLTYRIRRPRGVPPDRGGEARIARSTDLQRWDDVWSVTKDKFQSASIERCALRKSRDGKWYYFTSYVDPDDGRWCVSVITADSVKALDPFDARPLFKARALALEGVKDPWILPMGGLFYMFLSVALPTTATSGASHSTLDIFNTGECASATALAVSQDLENWQWDGVIFATSGTGWDSYCRRINSVVPLGGQFLAFYDGSASHRENYEEKTGLAVSSDLRNWKSLTPDAPFLTSPHSSTSLRYLDAQLIGNSAHLFYEFARPDAAHDLRLITTDLASLEALNAP
ncbi:MAG TPA: hypothetical protein VLT36_04045 [Candidatus Dormibacteraeota bacterium]|nr:hypothetical protein [Candidatus Dormibacteraeota bacterium]